MLLEDQDGLLLQQMREEQVALAPKMASRIPREGYLLALREGAVADGMPVVDAVAAFGPVAAFGR